MRTSVQRWGNSVGIRIPKVVAQDAALRSGSIVELLQEGGAIIIRPIRNERPRYRLGNLVPGDHLGESPR